MVPAVVYLRDRFVEPEAAVVSIFDRGYLLGDSVFETLRVHEGRIFRLGRHLDRLAEAARTIEIPLPVAIVELARIAAETVARSTMLEATLRITLSRGTSAPGIVFDGDEEPTLSVIARERPVVPESIPSGIAHRRRVPTACLPPSKTGNYLPQVLARRELARRGLGEGVMLSIDDDVVSGTASNVFVVKDGGVATPPLSSGCRAGVVREALLEASLGIEEKVLDVDALQSADEIFFTSSHVGVLPVSQFEGRALTIARARTVADELGALMRAS